MNTTTSTESTIPSTEPACPSWCAVEDHDARRAAALATWATLCEAAGEPYDETGVGYHVHNGPVVTIGATEHDDGAVSLSLSWAPRCLDGTREPLLAVFTGTGAAQEVVDVPVRLARTVAAQILAMVE